MEEFIFRAFHKKNKKMYWFNLLWGNTTSWGGGYIGMVEIGKPLSKAQYKDNIEMVDPENCEISEYLGLVDKNKNNICEDDFAKYNDEIFIIEYSNGGFLLKNKNNFVFINEILPFLELEIIGNRFENYELTKNL